MRLSEHASGPLRTAKSLEYKGKGGPEGKISMWVLILLHCIVRVCYFLALELTLAPSLPFYVIICQQRKYTKSLKWNSNVAAAPVRDWTKMAFVCACVCVERQGECLRMCAYEKSRAWGCSVCVCSLRWDGKLLTVSNPWHCHRWAGESQHLRQTPTLPLFPVLFLLYNGSLIICPLNWCLKCYSR